jgi:hypothetical protein
MPVLGHRLPTAAEPMDAWLARPARVEY